MRNVYKIEQNFALHNKLYFSLSESPAQIQIQPAGRVIADSDNTAFIYIVEEAGTYSYLSFSESLWPALVKMLKNEEDPFLTIGETTIELSNFYEELHALIFNIEGNGNYGDIFVAAVEEAFKEVLAGN
ncbi:hypothetical protein [Lysinibacillus sp. 54212]|uniref:UPF0738 family protein n=1 Tax=Lysinibacillus sp. 54212 TaxID=3119829 RepID=UPI002FCC05F2